MININNRKPVNNRLLTWDENIQKFERNSFTDQG